MTLRLGLLPWIFPLFLTAPPGYADASWSAEVGLGGVVVPGAWAPLRVESARASGPWTLEAGPGVFWEFPGPGVFERPIFLPDGLQTLLLRRVEGGLVQDEKALSLSREFPGNVIVTYGLDAAANRALGGILLPQEPVLVVEEPPVRWPGSFFAYDMVTALAVRDPGPVLSPAQVEAFRAWVASGGRWAVTDRKSPSLIDQVGPMEGSGAPVPDPAKLSLDLYGTNPRLGADFSPSAKNLPEGPGPETVGALGFLGGWGLLVLLLSRTRNPAGRAWWVVAASMVAVLVLFFCGAFSWDRGVMVHSRQIFLPSGAGAVTSIEAVASPRRVPFLEWPEASPWGLATWKTQAAGTLVRAEEPGRFSAVVFAPAPARTSPDRVRWTGSTLLWYRGADRLEATPAEYRADLPWITRIAAREPPGTWSVGMAEAYGGPLCWMALSGPGVSP